MVFVKFHNMNRKKKILMSPLNSNSKKCFFTLQQVKTILQSQFKMFSFLFFFFFNLCTDVLSILLKMSFLSFWFFSYAVSNNVQVSSFFFFSFRLFLLSCTFLFLFSFFFHFYFFHFFHNKLLIQCPFFFQPYIYLSVFTLTRKYRFASQFIQFQSTVP